MRQGLKKVDPRFANVQTDPRFRLPGAKQNKVTLDRRFARVLDDRDFHGSARVDRYGRRLPKDKARRDLEKYYRVDEQVEVSPSECESSESSSSDDASTTEESDLEQEVFETAGDGDVVVGEESRRLAVVNLDWDNIRASDLFAVFSSFLPADGGIVKVSVFPSEFGRDRMQREELEGPPREMFDRVQESEEQDAGKDFNSAKLRKYQLERLRYFYAVITCSSVAAARHIYEAVDGTEYLTSANFFDLRYIPEEMDFAEDKPRDECEEIPAKYRPTEFVTDALQHSKVKLTWDMDDGERREAQKRAFSGSRAAIDENDLKAYLGSSSSESEPEAGNMRALLGLTDGGKEPKETGGMQVTFQSGLNAEKGSVFENTPVEATETTAERYVRKEKERRARRRAKKAGALVDETSRDADLEQKNGLGDPSAEDDPFFANAAKESRDVDLGFDDPFFTNPKEKSRKKKGGDGRTRLKPGISETENEPGGEEKTAHFDMKALARAEKRQGRKRKRLTERDKEALAIQAADGFRMNVDDARFASVFERPEYAIDPTHPRYVATAGMKKLLGRRTPRADLDDTMR